MQPKLVLTNVWSGLVMICLSATPALAQAAPTASATVEILGLRRWTADMLRDSVERNRPGTKFSDAACALLLRDSMHCRCRGVEVS